MTSSTRRRTTLLLISALIRQSSCHPTAWSCAPDTVRNESDAEALAYVVFAPGREMERFMRAAGALSTDGPPTIDAVLALADRPGIEITAR
jgi:hypothetical protein